MKGKTCKYVRKKLRKCSKNKCFQIFGFVLNFSKFQVSSRVEAEAEEVPRKRGRQRSRNSTRGRKMKTSKESEKNNR